MQINYILRSNIMIKSNMKKEFKCDKEKLWNIVTDNSNYSWRSDLSRIEITDDKHFTEYTKNNYPTYFTVTSKEYLKEYKFDIKNTNIKGKWTGIFQATEDGNVLFDMTEEIETDMLLMKLLAKPYLKNQQKRYLKDLENELTKR